MEVGRAGEDTQRFEKPLTGFHMPELLQYSGAYGHLNNADLRL